MRVVKAAAVQLSPVLYSREGTVDKAVRKVYELGQEGGAVRHVPGSRGALLPVLFVRPATLPDHWGNSRPELLSLLIDRTSAAHVHERVRHSISAAEPRSEDLLSTVVLP